MVITSPLQDIKATISCSEWLCIVGGSSTGEQRKSTAEELLDKEIPLKFVEPGGNSDGLKGSDIDPCLLFHYGIPSGCNMLAYDPIQKILACSFVSITLKDGRIKLSGKDNTQALLESVNAIPSKFLQFVENQGILVNVNSKNHIEASLIHYAYNL
ncbi:unnamed protein product [Prunus armeniaca]|uniref:Uncharacterized protein n=1 Tax=Prunus armeniaca TaxID=36596 RepID=A0A6J5TXY9_PRUAR|nr:unnamed protein product [Prunus armeniaca]